MSNSNIPSDDDLNLLKDLYNPTIGDYNKLISSVTASIKSITDASSMEIKSIVKSFEFHDMNKQLTGFGINSGLIKAVNSVMSEQYAKQFSSQTYVSEAFKGVLKSSLLLYKVQQNYLSDYLKNPIFDIYDLNTEINTDLEENIEQDFDIENVEIFEDSTNTDGVNRIITVLPFTSVLDKVKNSNIDALHWREFEELIAELLREDGWDAELQQGTKDGGVDVIATREIPHVGFFKCIFQAKKQTLGNKVELPTIKELAFNRDEFKANKAILVTTSFLTKGARDLIQRDSHILGKKERGEVELWISDVINRR